MVKTIIEAKQRTHLTLRSSSQFHLAGILSSSCFTVMTSPLTRVMIKMKEMTGIRIPRNAAAERSRLPQLRAIQERCL
jgi:hypothetical protein